MAFEGFPRWQLEDSHDRSHLACRLRRDLEYAAVCGSSEEDQE